MACHPKSYPWYSSLSHVTNSEGLRGYIMTDFYRLNFIFRVRTILGNGIKIHIDRTDNFGGGQFFTALAKLLLLHRARRYEEPETQHTHFRFGSGASIMSHRLWKQWREERVLYFWERTQCERISDMENVVFAAMEDDLKRRRRAVWSFPRECEIWGRIENLY